MSARPHIFTLTGNLLAERTFEFPNWSPGKTHRATRETFQVGGKGINVSKMLSRLGAANTALCFTGGASGVECERWLESHGFSYRAFHPNRGTRVGTVVRSSNHPETTFLGPDISPSAEAIVACADFLDAQPAGQILACCGSFPGWDHVGFQPLRDALSRWLVRGVLVADTYGPPLAWLADQPLALVKINAHELRTLIGDFASVSDALEGESSRWPVMRWVVSDGPGAVTFREGLTGKVDTLLPPVVREISATGSGDVLFASLLHSLFLERTTLQAALNVALPRAAANAAHPGVAEFPEAPEQRD
ncbi:MAG TPA: PfkB family carbohydrate kinase [Opitutus sp.]|nr:PfkB family carbohydrate kinase [Opitutus sp.]